MSKISSNQEGLQNRQKARPTFLIDDYKPFDESLMLFKNLFIKIFSKGHSCQ